MMFNSLDLIWSSGKAHILTSWNRSRPRTNASIFPRQIEAIVYIFSRQMWAMVHSKLASLNLLLKKIVTSVCQKSVLHFQASDNSVYAFTCKVENYLGSDARNTFICKNTITSINYLHTNGFLFVMIISFKENSGSRTFCLYHHVLSTRFLWPFVFVTYTYSAQ